MTRMFNRREALTAGAGLAGAVLLGSPAAHAKNDADEAIKKFTGGKVPTEGKVKLDLPEIAENGNTVPMTVTVESPMTDADHVKAIHVFTEKNPQPFVIGAHIGPRAGRAKLATRARIADTGKVIAIAEMSDGSFWSDSVEVIITLGACLEDNLI